MKVSEMREKLTSHYGKKMKSLEKKTKEENPKATERGILNTLSQVVEEVDVEGLFAGADVRSKDNGSGGMTITRVTFKLLRGADVVFIRVHDTEYVKTLPPQPPMLTGTRWHKVQSVFNVLTEKTMYTTGPNTTFEPAEVSLKGSLDIVTIREAIRRDENKPDPEKWIYQYISGEISQVSFTESDDWGDKLRITIRDKNGDEIRSNITENLKDIFGPVEWLNDIEVVKNNLYHMNIISRGRINVMEPEGERERPITSWVVKNGGFLADSENIAVENITDVPEDAKPADKPAGNGEGLLSYIKKNDKGDGIRIQSIIEKGEWTEEDIEELINAGQIFEPTLGVVKCI